MRTPKRKPGKFSDLKPDPKITQQKHDELVAEAKSIQRRRPDLIREVQRLAEMGDFSENAAYQMAKGRLRGMNWRLLEIEDHLRTAEIITSPTDTDQVHLGSTVTFTMNGVEKTFKILGSSETDPNQSIISYTSPLGSVLMEMKTGESKKVRIADKEVECKILKIQ